MRSDCGIKDEMIGGWSSAAKGRKDNDQFEENGGRLRHERTKCAIRAGKGLTRVGPAISRERSPPKRRI